MVRFPWAMLLAFTLVASACGRDPVTPTPAPTLGPGSLTPATPASFRSTMRSLRGKPVVVNFWATWCDPCRDEMPRIVEAARSYKGRVSFLGVDVQDDDAAARAFIRANRMPFPSLSDRDRAIQRDQSVVGLPVTQFYLADGDLAFVNAGEIQLDELRARIEELLTVGDPVPSGGGRG